MRLYDALKRLSQLMGREREDGLVLELKADKDGFTLSSNDREYLAEGYWPFEDDEFEGCESDSDILYALYDHVIKEEESIHERIAEWDCFRDSDWRYWRTQLERLSRVSALVWEMAESAAREEAEYAVQ